MKTFLLRIKTLATSVVILALLYVTYFVITVGLAIAAKTGVSLADVLATTLLTMIPVVIAGIFFEELPIEE